MLDYASQFKILSFFFFLEISLKYQNQILT